MEGSKVLGAGRALLLAVAASGVLGAQDAAPEPFTYDAWTAWDAFMAGAWVEHEVRTVTGRAPGPKVKFRRMVESKAAASITLNVERVAADGGVVPGPKTETITKRAKDAAASRNECTRCAKVHPSDARQSTHRVKVGTADLECIYVESTVLDCEGRKLGKLLRWFHKDIPGWLVKQETIVDDRVTTMTCTGYGNK